MMNNDLISRSALLKDWDALDETQDPNLLIDAMIKATQDAPAVDAVSLEVLEQYKWERDIAIAQLEELGIGFGEKKPDMQPVRHGRWMPVTVSGGRDSWQCSECGRRARGKRKNLPYCHCGAKMDGDKDAVN